MKIPLLSLALTAALACHLRAAPASAAPETQYLVFQVWPQEHGYPGLPTKPGHPTLTKEQMAGFIGEIAKAIGTKGDARHKLGFAAGPFSFDVSDDDTRQWIHDAFAAARENDVAVAIHLDDSMAWGERKDLLANPDNIETTDWQQTPNKARALHWGVSPMSFPPQMCYNAPAIVAAAKDRGALIGQEIAHELATLKSAGKEYLFAGIIAGSETQIGSEYGTEHPLGFRALAHRGFSESHPPKDLDAERASVVKEWMQLWANALNSSGVPREKIFCHIAFTSQGLRKPSATETYAQMVHFAVPEVAFDPAYRPGFSTYPEGATTREVHAIVAAHGNPGWISAEGTNVSPTSMPGEPNMETYLAKMFNYGAVLTNVFSWGIGGEAQRQKNFFRVATENPEALAAYGKFLKGEPLVETSAGASGGFSSEAFQAKMRRIQAELPAWIQKTGQQATVMPMIQKIKDLTKAHQWQEADKAADELLALLPTASQ